MLIGMLDSARPSSIHPGNSEFIMLVPLGLPTLLGNAVLGMTAPVRDRFLRLPIGDGDAETVWTPDRFDAQVTRHLSR